MITTFQDALLEHQIRIVACPQTGLSAVSCNCMEDGDGRFIPLTEPAELLPADAARAAYNQHVAEVNRS